MESPEKAALLMRRAAMASVGVALTLTLLKAGAYLVSNSVAMLASMADSGLDLLASAANYVAIRQALTPADREHRFGHGKAEPLAALGQAAFIAGSAVFLVFEAGQRLVHPQPVSAPTLGIAGPGIATLPLARRLRSRIERVGLASFAGLLILIGLVFLVPPIHAVVEGPFWFFTKVVALFYGMVWLRGTLPRFRYDQLMNIGWKVLIPLGLASVLVNAVIAVLRG